MGPESVKTRIGEDDLQTAPGRWIVLQDSLDIAAAAANPFPEAAEQGTAVRGAAILGGRGDIWIGLRHDPSA
jgi:hypothetical protein